MFNIEDSEYVEFLTILDSEYFDSKNLDFYKLDC